MNGNLGVAVSSWLMLTLMLEVKIPRDRSNSDREWQRRCLEPLGITIHRRSDITPKIDIVRMVLIVPDLDELSEVNAHDRISRRVNAIDSIPQSILAEIPRVLSPATGEDANQIVIHKLLPIDSARARSED